MLGALAGVYITKKGVLYQFYEKVPEKYTEKPVINYKEIEFKLELLKPKGLERKLND